VLAERELEARASEDYRTKRDYLDVVVILLTLHWSGRHWRWRSGVASL
jgi:hypothetical protein